MLNACWLAPLFWVSVPLLVWSQNIAPSPLAPALSSPSSSFDIRTEGAVGDGITFDTAAIQKAIDACAGTGGTVVLPAGGRYLTAPLVLGAHMIFSIQPGAVLLGSTLPADYPDKLPAQTAAHALRKSLLFADHADGLVLEGGGTIDGQGQRLPMVGKESTRPSLLRIFSSDHVIVRNLTLRNPRMWTDTYSECTNLLIDHLQVFAPRGYCPNLDGMDVCDSDHVTVSNCHIEAQDDGICLKSHGLHGLHDITIRNNVVRDFDANGIKLGTATHGPFEHILIENNIVESARFAGLCIESVDGAHVHDIQVRHLELHHVAQPIYIRLSHRDPPRHDLQFSNTVRAPAGSIDQVLLEDVHATDPDAHTIPSNTLTGIPEAHLGAIVIRNSSFSMTGGLTSIPPLPAEHDGQYPQSNQFGQVPGFAFFIRHASSVTLDHVTATALRPDARPWLAKEDANVQLINCTPL